MTDDLEKLIADAARYRWLRDNPSLGFSLAHNDHKMVYEDAEKRLEREIYVEDGYYSGISGSEREAMIAADSIWTLQIYPNTPVGFNVYHAASLDRVIDAAMREGVDE